MGGDQLAVPTVGPFSFLFVLKGKIARRPDPVAVTGKSDDGISQQQLAGQGRLYG
jgi:hypothetical protein